MGLPLRAILLAKYENNNKETQTVLMSTTGPQRAQPVNLELGSREP